MAHSHSHGGQHHHHPHPSDFGWAFAVGIVLNLGFVAVETIYGFLANSMALLADAGHNLADVLALATAWGGAILAKRPPSRRFSYGLRAASILAALANSVILLIAVSFIAYHAVMRLIIPDLVAGETVTIVAGIGIVINGATALMFARGRRSDINIRGAYLHMVADAAVSAGVVVAGLAIAWLGWLWIDPVASLIVAGLIFLAGADLMRDSVTMALAGVPRGIDPDAVEAHLLGLPGVARIHDLHIWPMSTTEFALTAHLVIPAGFPGDAFLAECAHGVAHGFGITHATFQVEIGEECVTGDSC
ncbi:MAG: cobalt-zinc-cadmium efflux system protein [Sphingomonadales bacterium]|nr:cobalt-zinc-cadmium efflux system protein [Sphingomonadales bacterium]MEA3045236.1 cobalt-zinc-cadmium efflux system protein [Sphingomonadales bacterium]